MDTVPTSSSFDKDGGTEIKPQERHLYSQKASLDEAVLLFLSSVSETPRLKPVLRICKAILEGDLKDLLQQRADFVEQLRSLRDSLKDDSICEMTLHLAVLSEEVERMYQALCGSDEDDLDHLNLIFHQRTVLGSAFEQYRVVVTCSSERDLLHQPEDHDGLPGRQESQYSDSYSPQASELFEEPLESSPSNYEDFSMDNSPRLAPEPSTVFSQRSLSAETAVDIPGRPAERDRISSSPGTLQSFLLGDKRLSLFSGSRMRMWEKLHQLDQRNRGRRQTKQSELWRRRESANHAPPPKQGSFKRKDAKDTNLRIVCRICEESVPLAQMHDHSNLCIQRTNSESMFRMCDDKLLTVIKEIDEYVDCRLQKAQASPATPRCAEELAQARALRDLALDIYELEFEPRTSAPVGLGLAEKLGQWKEANAELASLAGAVDNILTLCHAKLKALKQCPDATASAPAGPRWFGRVSSVGGGALVAGQSVVAPAPDRGMRKKRRRPSVNISDFEVIRAISRGAYGRVFLARKRKTRDLYAIKVLRRSEVESKTMAARILNERNILASCYNPHIVKFFYSFSSPKNLFLVTEYLPGGDCFSLLHAKGGVLAEPLARQIVAEVTLALGFLHELQVVHRDLKPDNILIDADGHVKLTDFGISDVGLQTLIQPFAAAGDLPALRPSIAMEPDTPVRSRAADGRRPRTPQSRLPVPNGGLLEDDHCPAELSKEPECATSSTATADTTAGRPGRPPTAPKAPEGRPTSAGRATAVCGTPDYLAPELLLQQPHSFPVDWWALGIILYEFLYGCPPFNDESPAKIFRNILEAELEIPDPDEDEEPISEEAIDVMTKFIHRDPATRLGAGGLEEIKAHPFFAEVNWENLLSAPSLIALAEGKAGDPEATLKNFDARQKVFKMSAADLVIDDPGPPGRTSPPAHADPEFGQFGFVHAMHLADLTERAARSQLEALNWACRGCGEINEFLAAECVSCGCPEDWDPFAKGGRDPKKAGLGKIIASGFSSIVAWRANNRSTPRRPSVSSESSGRSSIMGSPTQPKPWGKHRAASRCSIGSSPDQDTPGSSGATGLTPRQNSTSFLEKVSHAVTQKLGRRPSPAPGSPRALPVATGSRRGSLITACSQTQSARSKTYLAPIGEDGSPLTPNLYGRENSSTFEHPPPPPLTDGIQRQTSTSSYAGVGDHPSRMARLPAGSIAVLKRIPSHLRLNLAGLGSGMMTPDTNSPGNAGRKDVTQLPGGSQQQLLTPKLYGSSRGTPREPTFLAALGRASSSSTTPRRTSRVGTFDGQPTTPDGSPSHTDLADAHAPPLLPPTSALLAPWHSRRADSPRRPSRVSLPALKDKDTASGYESAASSSCGATGLPAGGPSSTASLCSGDLSPTSGRLAASRGHPFGPSSSPQPGAASPPLTDQILRRSSQGPASHDKPSTPITSSGSAPPSPSHAAKQPQRGRATRTGILSPFAFLFRRRSPPDTPTEAKVSGGNSATSSPSQPTYLPANSPRIVGSPRIVVAPASAGNRPINPHNPAFRGLAPLAGSGTSSRLSFSSDDSGPASSCRDSGKPRS
eukprot:EG_transcript_179